MQFIHYLGGETRTGKLVAIGLGLSTDPTPVVAELQKTQPFQVRLLAIEHGTSEKLENLKDQFRVAHLHGFWYQPTPELRAHVEAIESVDPESGRTIRVSLDLSPEEFADLGQLVTHRGLKAKSKLLRRALRLYGSMHRYKSQGYAIQAVKGGKMIQFPDLDAIE